MNYTQTLKSLLNELDIIESSIKSTKSKLKTAIKEREEQERDVLLSRADAEKVMGYQSGYFKQMDVAEPVPIENDLIRFSKLYEWAKRNRKNRLKRMRKNISEYY